MKILLVEPNYERKYLPLGLMKISSYHKLQGDEVKYTRGMPNFVEEEYDKIYITSLFSWNIDMVMQYALAYCNVYGKEKVNVGGVCATLKKDIIKEKVGINVAEGIQKEFEFMTPDYSLFEPVDYRIGFTSRGCPNLCGWCMVKYHEPGYIEYDDWETRMDLRANTKEIIMWDNNFLAATDKHFDECVQKFRVMQRPVDFNQGLDARLFTKEKAYKMSMMKMNFIRFAFDSMLCDGHVQRSLDYCKEFKIKAEPRCYVLYNFKDTPENFYYRLRQIREHGGKSYPMKYQDLDASEKGEYVGKHWNKNMLHNFSEILNKMFKGGMIGSQKMEIFEDALGKNEKEFVDKLNNEDKNYSHKSIDNSTQTTL